MVKRLLLLLLFAAATLFEVAAQEALPGFRVRNAGNNRIVIGWINPFQNIAQISIQRSADSLGIYKTIISLADPKSVQNGFTDTKAPNDRMFYRIFYAMEGGTYYFTKAKRPDTTKLRSPALAVAPRLVIGARDIPYKYKDSIFVRNRDTLLIVNRDTLRVTAKDTVVVKATLPKEVKKPEWIPSKRIFSGLDGNVLIRLPDAPGREYSIKFYDNTELILEIPSLSEKELTLDKANFHHSGWFFFELYDDKRLVERNKFFLKP